MVNLTTVIIYVNKKYFLTLIALPKKSVATLALISIGLAASFWRWLVVFFDPFGVRATSSSLTGVLEMLVGALVLPWEGGWLALGALAAAMAASILVTLVKFSFL